MDDTNLDTNPLAEAFNETAEAITTAYGIDFIGSTLAAIDEIDNGTVDLSDSVTQLEDSSSDADDDSSESTEDSSDDTDPLKAIDDAFPDLDDKASTSAKVRWGELKTELKQEREAMRELKKELEDLKNKSLYDPTEVETLKKQLSEYDKELAVHKIEATQEYRTVIETPLKSIGDAAAAIARRYEIENDTLFDALAEQDEAKQHRLLTDVVDGMNDRDRLKIYQMADDTLALLKKRDEMKERSQEALQELEIRQKQTQEQSQAEQKRKFTGHIDRMFEAFDDKIPFVALESNETKSAVLEQLKKDALKTNIASAGLDVQAYSAAAGVVLPRLIKQFRAIATENKALKDRMSGLNNASPARSRTVPTQVRSSSSEPDFLSAVFSGLGG